MEKDLDFLREFQVANQRLVKELKTTRNEKNNSEVELESMKVEFKAFSSRSISKVIKKKVSVRSRFFDDEDLDEEPVTIQKINKKEICTYQMILNQTEGK